MNPDDLPASPLETASFLSKALFCWILDLFRLGSKRDLEISDLYRLSPENKSENLGATLDKVWRDQISLTAEWNSKNKDQPRTPSLLRALMKLYFWKVAVIGLHVFFIECIIKIAQVIFLMLIIKYYDGEFEDKAGYMFAVGLFLSSGLLAIFYHPYYFLTTCIGMKCRVACSSLIYRKSLKLSQAAIGKTNVGQMVNLLSNDVNRFDLSVNFLHYLWAGPVQLCVATYIMWTYYKWTCLIGVAVLLLFAPLQGLMGTLFGKLRLKVAERTDGRVRIMSEIVHAARIIKMYAWEYSFGKLISDARAEEVVYIRKTAFLNAVNASCNYISSKLAIFLTLLTFVLTGNTLKAEEVFVALLLFNHVRLSMTFFFPMAVAQVAEALASIKRLEKFLLMEERDLNPTAGVPRIFGGEVTVVSVRARWSGAASTDLYTLQDVSLSATGGQLLAVVGSVGSGKTSLLQVLLHELPTISGAVRVRGTIAYASQQPWIFSGTVRENIIFGRDYEYDRYHQVIKACALTKDLALFPFYDQTLVGDRGISLSGGQKARINLARAVYSDADIYLLDAPLSSVDAEVAKHIFDNCIMGILKEKVKILVTHQLQFLKPAHEIILLSRGKVIARGNYKELLSLGVDFAEALHLDEQGPWEENDDESNQASIKGVKAGSSKGRGRPSLSLIEMWAAGGSLMSEDVEMEDNSMIVKSYELHYDSCKDSSPKLPRCKKPKKISSVFSSGSSSDSRETTPLTPQQHDETMVSGEIGAAMYWRYISADASIIGLIILLLLIILSQALFSGFDLWLQYWTTIENRMNSEDNNKESENTHIYIYCGLIGAIFFVNLIRNFTFLQMCVNSSIELHRRLFQGVMRAPMRFFEMNPAGRVINRFAKDVGIIDEALPMSMFDTVESSIQVIGAMAIISVNIPYLLIPSFFLVVILFFIRKFYLKTASSVARLEGIARGPVFNHLSTSICGLTTIRAMGVESQFEKQFDVHQDLHSATWFIFLIPARWLGIVVDSWCVVYIGVILFTFLLMEDVEDSSSAVGLSLATAMSLMGLLQFGVRRSADVENFMVSVERAEEYADIEPEASLESLPDAKPPSTWPTRGEIVFNNVVMKYGDDAPVLKNIDCVFKSQEKIGIVGRTGAGKSSLITALFRITEPYEGNIEIDGVNVLKIGLHDLRQKISIIPQDPVLFNATLRKNLDPLGDYKDEVLWVALGDVYLADTVKEYPAGLDTEIAEDGSNFSVGQRQLICLARAILRRSTILVLDEATAAVDHVTDCLIQRAIREKFEKCTVLTIAHRLHTVMDSDRILVLDAGEVKEFDEPYNLLCDKASALSQLVETTGKATAALLFKMAGTARDRRILLASVSELDEEDSSQSSSSTSYSSLPL